MTFSEATDTLHSCNFTHQKAQSLLDDMKNIIKKKQNNTLQTYKKRASMLAEAAQQKAH